MPTISILFCPLYSLRSIGRVAFPQLLGLGRPVAPAGSFTGRITASFSATPSGRSPRIRCVNPAIGGTAQPRHLPYLLNPGLCYVVLAYPGTGPYRLPWALASRQRGNSSAHSFALGLPSDSFSRRCPCRRLMFMSVSHDTDRVHT